MKFVPFSLVRHHLGGFSDDELRQALVRAKAVRFADNNMVEHWCLLGRLSKDEAKDLANVKVPVSTAKPTSKLLPATAEQKNAV